MASSDELLAGSGLDKPDRWDAADEPTRLAWLESKGVVPTPGAGPTDVAGPAPIDDARANADDSSLEARLARLEAAGAPSSSSSAAEEVHVRGRGSVVVADLARCPVGVVAHECGLNAPDTGGRLTSDLEGNAPAPHCWRCGYGALTTQSFEPTYRVHPTLGLVESAAGTEEPF